MRKDEYYDEEYCIKLIKLALSPNGKNGGINQSAIKKRILEKLDTIKNQYGVSSDDICYEICTHFLNKKIITKINRKKGCPSTFILHYVFNQLRNIERSCARGKFQKINGNCDAMDMVAYNFKDLDRDPNWITELIDYNDPESLLIARDTLHQLQDHLGEQELSVLLGDLDMERYCTTNGISRRSGYRRLARSRQILDEQVVADID